MKKKKNKIIYRIMDSLFDIKEPLRNLIYFVYGTVLTVLMIVTLELLSSTQTAFESIVVSFILMIYIAGIFIIPLWTTDGFFFYAFCGLMLAVVLKSPILIEISSAFVGMCFFTMMLFKYLKYVVFKKSIPKVNKNEN